ncbi:MAG: substrate-binding domain-containing protein, partial [Streptosporangiales bacterium]|nr:substrate-binding domain-containing protein [Streptosporangiales bacterium]
MRRPTLHDVAARAEVHPATASRALNPRTRHLVNGETAARVDRAASALGYRANPIARSLKTARSATVGLILPDLTNPLFPPIVRGIEDELGQSGYSALIVNTDNDEERERTLVESLRSRQVEGLIVGTARLDHPLLWETAAELPVVLVNRGTGDDSVPRVLPDDIGGVTLAMRHLAALGHRRIAHLAGPQDLGTGVNRLRGYRQAVADLGLDDDPALVETCESWTETAGADAMRRLLDNGVPFTAVQAGNDLLALGCYDVFEERELTCPAAVSVVGFNDMPFLDKLRPPLTSVHIPQYELGAEAGRLLLDRLKEPDRHPRSVLLPLTL